MKIANHHIKQLTPSESCDPDKFFYPGFWGHHIQIIRLELLQEWSQMEPKNCIWKQKFQLQSKVNFKDIFFHLQNNFYI